MSDVIERIKKRINENMYRMLSLSNDCIALSDNEVNGLQRTVYDECLKTIDEELAKEPQGCKWVKGINIIETCWGDLPAKRIGKKYGWRYCPFCGKEIRWSNEHK